MEQATVFTPAQIYLLKLFETIKTEEELLEVEKVTKDYYAKRLNDHLNELWDEGIHDQKRLDEINEMDLHELMRTSN